MKQPDIIVPVTGSAVKIGNGEIDGVLTGISIYGTRVLYQVTWWSGRDRKCEWLDECELSSESQVMRIGFIGA